MCKIMEDFAAEERNEEREEIAFAVFIFIMPHGLEKSNDFSFQ